MPIPDALVDRPHLNPGNELYWTAFWRLDSYRPIVGNGVGKIPWGAIMDYCDRLDLDDRQRETMELVIDEMDKVLLKYLKERKDS
jgi:hypothetical protein